MATTTLLVDVMQTSDIQIERLGPVTEDFAARKGCECSQSTDGSEKEANQRKLRHPRSKGHEAGQKVALTWAATQNCWKSATLAKGASMMRALKRPSAIVLLHA